MLASASASGSRPSGTRRRRRCGEPPRRSWPSSMVALLADQKKARASDLLRRLGAGQKGVVEPTGGDFSRVGARGRHGKSPEGVHGEADRRGLLCGVMTKVWLSMHHPTFGAYGWGGSDSQIREVGKATQIGKVERSASQLHRCNRESGEDSLHCLSGQAGEVSRNHHVGFVLAIGEKSERSKVGGYLRSGAIDLYACGCLVHFSILAPAELRSSVHPLEYCSVTNPWVRFSGRI